MLTLDQQRGISGSRSIGSWKSSRSSPPPTADLATQLEIKCKNLQTGKDLGSLLEVSSLMRQLRLNKQREECKKVQLTHFQLDSAKDTVRRSNDITIRAGPNQESIDVSSVEQVLAAGRRSSEEGADAPKVSNSNQPPPAPSPPPPPNTLTIAHTHPTPPTHTHTPTQPLHWFHVDSYYDPCAGDNTNSGTPRDGIDQEMLLRLGKALSIEDDVIIKTMDNYSMGKIAIENGSGCVGIAFVDIMLVAPNIPEHYKSGASAHHGAASRRRSATLVHEEQEQLFQDETILQQPIAVFFSAEANACLSVRPPHQRRRGVSHVFNEGEGPVLNRKMAHWQNIIEQLEGKSSLLHQKVDAAYLLFLLIDEVVDTVEPLLNLYGDALEGMDYLFDRHDVTEARNKMSRRLQQDLWVIRRWGWSICTIAEDLVEDPWDVFTDSQEKPFKMLESQAKALSEISKAFIIKADAQEDFFSLTQETETNNLLFNLTMFTIVMVSPKQTNATH